MDACVHCHKRSIPLLRCTGCRTELFCSVPCQRAARASHAPFCQGVSKQRSWPSTTGLDCCPYCRANPRVAAADLPPLARYLADKFYSTTVLEDAYPGGEGEKLFGIEMGTPLGALAFASWQRLLCLGSVLSARAFPMPYACPAALAAALAAGALPAMFERAVRGLAAFTRSEPSRLQQLAERGFAGIPWDAGLHRSIPARLNTVAAPEYAPSWTFSDAPPTRDPSAELIDGFLHTS